MSDRARKRPGPPPSPDELQTKLTRVYSDVQEMISWIVKVEGGSSAQLLDPMIRPYIRARFESHRPAIEIMKKAQANRAASERRQDDEVDD